MQTDILTLEHEIRNKAESQLKKELQTLMDKLYEYNPGASDIQVTVREDEYPHLYPLSQIIKAVQQAIFDAHAQSRGDKAISDFIAKVDLMGNEQTVNPTNIMDSFEKNPNPIVNDSFECPVFPQYTYDPNQKFSEGGIGFSLDLPTPDKVQTNKEP